MSLNFYKSKIFIALAVCLGSIGISQTNVYGQELVTQSPVAKDFEGSGEELARLYYRTEVGLRAANVSEEQIQRFLNISRFLNNKEIRNFWVFRNFMPTHVSAWIAAINSPNNAARLVEDHNTFFSAAFPGNGDYHTYSSLSGNKLTVSYDAENDKVTQVSTEVDGRRQSFTGDNISNAYSIAQTIANRDNERFRQFGLKPLNVEGGEVSWKYHGWWTKNLVLYPTDPIWMEGRGWVSPKAPWLESLISNLEKAGYKIPIKTVGVAEFNQIAASSQEEFKNDPKLQSIFKHNLIEPSQGRDFESDRSKASSWIDQNRGGQTIDWNSVQ
jgi:hypothetical protein